MIAVVGRILPLVSPRPMSPGGRPTGQPWSLPPTRTLAQTLFNGFTKKYWMGGCWASPQTRLLPQTVLSRPCVAAPQLVVC